MLQALGGRIVEMAGVSIPISPKRRNGLLVEPEELIPDDWPFLIDLDTGLWIHPAPSKEPDGAVFVGGEFGAEDPTKDPDDPEMLSNSVTTEWAHKALDHATSTVNQIGESPRIHRGWAVCTPSLRLIIRLSKSHFLGHC